MPRLVRTFVLSVIAASVFAGVGFAQSKAKFDRTAHMDKVRQLKMIQKDLLAADDSEKKELTKEIETLATELFNMELLRQEDRITQLQEALQQQKKDRKKIIKERVARFLDPKASAVVGRTVTPNPYVVENMHKQKDGSMLATIRLTNPVQRTREVNYTVMVPQTRTRIVGGKEQTYTVNVPEQRTRTEAYTVQGLGSETHKVTIPKGEKPDVVLAKFASKQKAAKK